MRIQLGEYLRFLDSNPDSRNVVEGQNILQAGHVIMHGVTNDTHNQKEIFALCLQTSGLSNRPHEINISLRVSSEATIHHAICSCKGGANGRCKHVSAVLWICMSNDIEKFTALTSTDMACWWKEKQKKMVENYKLNRIDEQDCWKKKEGKLDISLSDSLVTEIQNAFAEVKTSSFSINRVEVETQGGIGLQTSDPGLDDEVLEFLANAILKSELTLLQEFKLQPCCKSTYSRLFAGTDWFSLPKLTKDKKEWAKARRWRVTASRCHELYTYLNNKNPDWQSKTENYFFPKSFSNKFVEHGLKYEEAALRAYEQHTNSKVVQTGLITHPGHLWIGCTPDGVICNPSSGVVKMIEIKCPYAGKTKSASEMIEDLTYIERGTLKRHHTYFSQIQLGMGLLNVPSADLILYSSFDNSIHIITVEQDASYFQDLVHKLQFVYFTHMMHNVCINKDWLSS